MVVREMKKAVPLPDWTRLFTGAFGALAKEKALPTIMRVLAAVLEHSEGDIVTILAKDIAAIVGVEPSGVSRPLKTLVDLGLLEAHGVTRGRFYRLSPYFFFRGDAERYPAAIQRHQRTNLRSVK